MMAHLYWYGRRMRWLIVDMDGVLNRMGPHLEALIRRAAELCGLSEQRVTAYFVNIRAGIEEDMGGIHATASHLFPDYPECHEAFIRAFHAQEERYAYPVAPDAIETLAWFRTHEPTIPLALCTNAAAEHAELRMMVNGIDSSWFSHKGFGDDQYRKPDSRALVAILKKLGASPAETFFVGDSPRDYDTTLTDGIEGTERNINFIAVTDLGLLPPEHFTKRGVARHNIIGRLADMRSRIRIV